MKSCMIPYVPYCPIWSCMTLYGAVWFLVVLNGPVWSCMVPYARIYGPVLLFMVPCGLDGLMWSRIVCTLYTFEMIIAKTEGLRWLNTQKSFKYVWLCSTHATSAQILCLLFTELCSERPLSWSRSFLADTHNTQKSHMLVQLYCTKTGIWMVTYHYENGHPSTQGWTPTKKKCITLLEFGT